MFCTKCGKELLPNAKFCQYCGNPVLKRERGLLERARSGEEDALTEIYRKSNRELYHVVKVMIQDDDTVYDILQDTYIKAFDRLDQLKEEEKLIPWLKTIANNTAKDWLKKKKPVFFSELSTGEDADENFFENSIEDDRTAVNPEITMDENESRRLVMGILDQLPAEQRLVVGMFYYEELSVKEIADVLGVSENTVKSRLSYARKKIKESVLILEKESGIRLHTVAPLPFFWYLLRSLKTCSPGAQEEAMLQKLGQTCCSSVAGRSEKGSSGRKTKENPASKEPSEQSVEAEPQQSVSTGQNMSADSARPSSGRGSAAKSASGAGTGGKAVKTVISSTAGGAVKHAGIKIAAALLAGAVGVGGAVYGVVKNADRIPVLQNLVAVPESETEQKKESEYTAETETEAETAKSEAATETENAKPETETETEAAKPETETETEAAKPETEAETEAVKPKTETETKAAKPETETETSEPETEKSEEEPQNVLDQGDYGKIHWYFDAEGTLTLRGDGAIEDQASGYPWEAHMNEVHRIVIENGITRIGSYAFMGYGYVSEIVMADTVMEIGESAFAGVIPASADTGIARTVTFSQSLETIEAMAFYSSNITAVDLPDSVREIGEGAFQECYQLRSLTISENSKLESIGTRAFQDCPLDLETISIPKGIRQMESLAFGSGNFADTITFSKNLKSLGMRAFGYGSTGAVNIYFQGDAPEITDQRIAVDDLTDAVFPDTTVVIYYPAGNSTWDGFAFSKLAKYAIAQSYEYSEGDESEAAGGQEEKSGNEDGVQILDENGNENVQEQYRTFYESYVRQEQLQVITDGLETDYDSSHGYQTDLLLGAYMADFGGDGKQELLLIRTREQEAEYKSEFFETPNIRRIYLELYGEEGTEIVLRSSIELAEGNLNESAAYVTEQIGVTEKEGIYYVVTYSMTHASAGGGEYGNTILRLTDKELQREHEMSYYFGGTSGSCIIDGIELYSGNADSDVNNLNNILTPFGMEAYGNVTAPRILDFEREQVFGGERAAEKDTFFVQNCFASEDQETVSESQENVQAEQTGFDVQRQDGYCRTLLNGDEGGMSPNGQFWMPGTVQVENEGNFVTFYASFSKEEGGAFTYSEQVFMEYAQRTFELTENTQYYMRDVNGDTPITKEKAISMCESLNGLVVTLKVTNGTVEKFQFSS